ncbi:hypothetical protein BH11ACT8_BH11ACT8_23190 [soil metagenome]
MSEALTRHARSFGGVADAYDRGRPGYPDDAVEWLVGSSDQQTVLELGAGTGKLTERLVALGHDVHATEPDEAMLAVLRRNLPDVRSSASGAEEIPVADHSVDVVIAAQCYHWFDTDLALAEIQRVLKPHGTLALVWHQRDERIPWVRKLGRVLGTHDQVEDPAASLAASELFGDVEAEVFKHWQTIDRRSVQDLARSRSTLAVMDDAGRDRVLADLLALYDDYGRGMDGMQLPYRTLCFRSIAEERVLPPAPEPEPAPEAELEPTVPIGVRGPGGTFTVRSSVTTGQASGSNPMTDSASTIPRVAVESDDDTAMLLIDFR